MIKNHAATISIIDSACTGHKGMQCSQCVHSNSSTTANLSSRKRAFTGHSATHAAQPKQRSSSTWKIWFSILPIVVRGNNMESS